MLDPERKVAKFTDVTCDMLEGMGAKGVMVDIDNTIVPHKSNEVTQEIIDWFGVLRGHGYEMCILTNNPKWRADIFSEALGIPAVSGWVKPWPWGFSRALRRIKTSPSDTVMVGDQLFTDVMGAKWMGMKAILVTPISQSELLYTKMLRKIEKLILRDGE